MLDSLGEAYFLQSEYRSYLEGTVTARNAWKYEAMV